MIPLDEDRLRLEIQKHSAEVANSPVCEFHFHTGRDAARRVGYDEAIIEDMPDDVIASIDRLWPIPLSPGRVQASNT